MRDRNTVEKPTLPVYGIAEYSTASPYKQMQVLADYKYPERGVPRASYYRDARETIRRFHGAGEDPEVIRATLRSLDNSLRAGRREYEATRVRNNARVLRSYLRHRSDRRYQLRRVGRTSMAIGGVTVHTNPDLLAVEAGALKLIKFDFGEKPPSDRFGGIVAECLYRGAQEARMDVKPSNVTLCSIEADREWRARPSVQRWRNITATCRQIAMLWPHVTPD
jgi:hypothetical protein